MLVISMHISEKLTALRRDRIIRIKSWMHAVEKAGKEIDRDGLVLEVMSKMSVSDRIAKELIKVAKYEFENFKQRNKEITNATR